MPGGGFISPSLKNPRGVTVADPLSTIQLYCENSRNLTNEQIAEIEKFYFEVRKLLVASPRFQGEADNDGEG